MLDYITAHSLAIATAAFCVLNLAGMAVLNRRKRHSPQTATQTKPVYEPSEVTFTLRKPGEDA